MKIIDRKSFLALPAGTMYFKYQPCCYDNFGIKGDTSCGSDWYHVDLSGAWLENAHNDMENFDILEKMQEEGISSPLDFETEGRDGLFDEHQLFAVLEKPDVEALITRLQLALTQGYS